MVHKLKTHPEWFNQWIHRNKSFEVRRDDRNFQVGDTVEQHEFNPHTKTYTGRVGVGTVAYVLRGFEGVARGFCVLECPFEKVKVVHSGEVYDPTSL